MVPLAGIEPASADYKSAALPLSENGMKKAPLPGGKDACKIQFLGKRKPRCGVHRGSIVIAFVH